MDAAECCLSNNSQWNSVALIIYKITVANLLIIWIVSNGTSSLSKSAVRINCVWVNSINQFARYDVHGICLHYYEHKLRECVVAKNLNHFRAIAQLNTGLACRHFTLCFDLRRSEFGWKSRTLTHWNWTLSTTSSPLRTTLKLFYVSIRRYLI